ncbi:MAG: hypothetical protein ACK4GL_06235 [Flavobacteriales bacterium]
MVFNIQTLNPGKSKYAMANETVSQMPFEARMFMLLIALVFISSIILEVYFALKKEKLNRSSRKNK